ncbi:oxidoreductase [Hyaloraphidium curvatum]|nr:oxidoreductase [Hyaloraphidium curvatum]
MPTHAPDYGALNAVSAGRAPGLGRLAGKRVLVVAGGQKEFPGDDPARSPGNGRAISVICGREGAAVAVHNRTVESAEATAAIVRGEPACPLAIPLAGDVTVDDDVKRIVAEAVDRLGGPLDGLVVNVGIFSPEPGLSLTMESLDKVMRTNFYAHVAFLKHAAPHIRPGGSVVLVSSAGYDSLTGSIPYDSSKAALEGLLRNAGSELAPSGTRVNVLRLGGMDTPLGRLASKVAPERLQGYTIPLQSRQGTSWEGAYFALFLLSDDSAYVTGQVHTIDGGLTTLRNITSR